MQSRSKGYAARAGALALAGVLLAGCSPINWRPWQRPPTPPPVPVHEVDIAGSGAEGSPQYWKRNTLLIDLSALSGSGSITLKPIEGSTWPVRLAFRVRPGSIAVLEVRGEERVSLPINATAGTPIDLELTPGVYTPKTAQLSVNWGPAPTTPQQAAQPMR